MGISYWYFQVTFFKIVSRMVKFIFDRIMALIGLLCLWPVLLVVWGMIRVKMPDGPALFKQKRVGLNGLVFTMYKFRSMKVGHGGSSVSVAGESRITPLGAFFGNTSLMSCLNCGMYSLGI